METTKRQTNKSKLRKNTLMIVIGIIGSLAAWQWVDQVIVPEVSISFLKYMLIEIPLVLLHILFIFTTRSPKQ